jgi:DNA-binding NtrC family response regulator
MSRPPDAWGGPTLLDRLRDEGDRTPVVIYSAARTPEAVEEARGHGAAGLTNSPQDLMRLVTRSLRAPA